MKPNAEFKNGLWIQFKQRLILQASVLLVCLTAANSPAQTYTILHTFGTNVMGLNPQAPLVQGPDGTLYGTTAGGGSANQGQVFKVNPDGTGYTVLKDFTGNDGANPEAGLVLSGTTLYGTTANGGTNSNGTVFSVNTDGSSYTVLHSFTGSDGAYPYGSLVLSGTTLYGTAHYGGTTGAGTVFSVNTDGTGFAVLKEFSGSDGGSPSGELVLSGSTLYGTTEYGGSSSAGTVFAVNTDGTGFTNLYSFTGGSDGANPVAALVLSGTTLYGTTEYGGSSSAGTVFAVNTDGTGFTNLYSFTGGSDGAYPAGGLILSSNTLYGTASGGGSSFNGTVFSVNTDGTGYTVLKDFTNSTDGVYPYAGLTLSGTTLYGTTVYGGNYGYGTVFSVESDGSSYTVLTNFAGSDGANPYASLTLSGSTLYGTTAGGGSSGNGTVFSVNIDGSACAVLYSFTEPAYGTNADGAAPITSLVLSGTTLYGTAGGGGVSGAGTVFSVNIDGTGFTNLFSFTGGSDGANPYANLTLSGTTLYGTTAYGGSSGNGTVFAVNTDGTGFTNLYSFTGGSDGAYPFGSVVLSGATLYGTTSQGGYSGNGTVFAVNTDGTGFTVLNEFNGDDGANPYGSLVLSGSTLYGTTEYGGSSSAGTVFAVNTDGTGFTNLYSFTGGSDGAYPAGGLILSSNTLYGTASGGGSFGNGTVFQINTDGSEFAVLKYFSGSDGANPIAGLVLSDSTLYGVTGGGGGLGNGVLFSLSPGPPMIASPPESQTAQAGSTIDLQVDASGYPPPSYQWFFNGTNAIAGATNSILEVTNVLFAQSGAYTVVITNAYGSVTSLVATLIVQDPSIITQPVSQTLHPMQTAVFSVVADGTPPLSFQWFEGGLTLNDGGKISGAQTSTLTLSNVLVADDGGYWVIVSNAYGSVTGAVAVLAVNQAVYSVLHDFSGSDGANPYANLTLSGSTLYGTTEYGGSYGRGTVFSVNTDGTGFTTLHSFTGGSDGASPYASLTLSGSTLYGTTANGGGSENGNVFSVNTDGTGFTVLKEFDFSDGYYPQAGLILSGNTLYGTTVWGGNAGIGTVFAVNTDGSGFTTLHSFTAVAWASSINATTNSDGANPSAGLTLSGNTLYGTTGTAGSSGDGTVFAVNTDGTGFTVLYSFTGSDGAHPYCPLILSGNTLYGTTAGGGSFGNGTVFSVNTDGTGFTNLYSFTGGSDGANPYANLTLSGSTLYGTTWGGGSSASGTVFYWGYGTVFAVNTDGTCFTTLHSFTALSGSGRYFGTNSDGAVPQAGLILSGNTLYGTTVWGGSSGGGTVFSLSLLPPTIITPPQSQTAELGSKVDFTVDAISSQPPAYQWLFNGTNLIICSTNCDLELTNVRFSQSGAYTVVITNVFGAVTSSPAVLNVIPAVERRPAPAINLMGEVGSSLNVEYTDALGTSANWLPLDTLSLTNPPQYCFDVSTPLPPQRFYRAWQTGTPSVIPSLNLNFVPAITLTGNIGDQLQVDYINQFGPTNAWVTLDAVTLTNTSQLYFDVSAIGQPPRLYQIVPVP